MAVPPYFLRALQTSALNAGYSEERASPSLTCLSENPSSPSSKSDLISLRPCRTAGTPWSPLTTHDYQKIEEEEHLGCLVFEDELIDGIVPDAERGEVSIFIGIEVAVARRVVRVNDGHGSVRVVEVGRKQGQKVRGSRRVKGWWRRR